MRNLIDYFEHPVDGWIQYQNLSKVVAIPACNFHFTTRLPPCNVENTKISAPSNATSFSKEGPSCSNSGNNATLLDFYSKSRFWNQKSVLFNHWSILQDIFYGESKCITVFNQDFFSRILYVCTHVTIE